VRRRGARFLFRDVAVQRKNSDVSRDYHERTVIGPLQRPEINMAAEDNGFGQSSVQALADLALRFCQSASELHLGRPALSIQNG